MTLRGMVLLSGFVLGLAACAAQRAPATPPPPSTVAKVVAPVRRHVVPQEAQIEVTETCDERVADLGSLGTGRLPHADIRKTLRTAQPSFDSCLNNANARGAQLHGTLAFAFVVGRDGKVVSAWADGAVSTITDPAFTCCVVQAVKRVVFPLPSGGSVLGRYSLNLVNESVASRSAVPSGS